MRHHHDSGDPSHDGTPDPALAELLDLDGEVLRTYWADALTWVRRAATGTGRARILDLGAGTGTGTIALAQRFAGAEVIAVDSCEDMLRRIRVKAVQDGLAERIHTVRADLDVVWPDVSPIDVTWASMSLHHLADPDRVLDSVHATTRPGGLVAVAELTEPLRFLPHDVGFGRPGLEGRCLDGLGREHAQTVPELGSDWSARISAAGFTVLSERTFTVDLNPPHPPSTARFAQLWLGRLRSALADRLAPDDLQALATLIDLDGPGSLRQRGDLRVRAARTVTLARRP